MRKSVISSLVTVVVAQVNDRLVAAGVALRTLFTRTWCMREQCRGWQEPRGIFLSPLPFGFGNHHSAKHPWAALKRSPYSALALCPAYAAAATFASGAK